MGTRNKAVVTGLGVVAANGIGVDAFWKALLNGQSGIGPITLFDANGLKTRIAGEVKGFVPTDYIDPALKPQRMGRFTQLALAATRMALADARLDAARLRLIEPFPIILGVSTSATEVIERQVLRINNKGHDFASPFTAIASLPHAAAGAIANSLRVKAQVFTVSTGCPAGLDAIAWAAALIRSGKADLAITGGTDASINMLTLATFCASDSLSVRNAEPARASRPFDRLRDGGLLAEGAGIVVLESAEHARARGATAYMTICGYGASADDAPDRPASGLRASMQAAIANAGCRAEELDAVCAHGPSDPLLDRVETALIKEVLGPRAWQIPVHSIKGVIGNPLASAGPLQVISCALTLRDGLLPPTANYENPDPECDLDYVPGAPRKIHMRYALVNTHGYGGSNSSLVVGRAGI